MYQIKIINEDAADCKNMAADMLFTDPPFDMPGAKLASILNQFDCPHLILITTARQLLEAAPLLKWRFAFDFILDAVVPKKSKSNMVPHYTHQTCAYMTLKKTKSAFNRKLRTRSDIVEASGYWPTIIRSPRTKMQEFGQAKNEQAITDILGSFAVKSVIDPFAGGGSTGLAALEIGIDAVLIEKDKERAQSLNSMFAFFT